MLRIGSNHNQKSHFGSQGNYDQSPQSKAQHNNDLKEEHNGNHTSLFQSLVDFTFDQVRPTDLPASAPTVTSADVEQSHNFFKHEQQIIPRKTKWEYAIPIVFTPVAHICVSLIRRYPQHKSKLYWGVGIATFLTIQARLILMYDAGYPGAEKPNQDGLPTFLKLLLF